MTTPTLSQTTRNPQQPATDAQAQIDAARRDRRLDARLPGASEAAVALSRADDATTEAAVQTWHNERARLLAEAEKLERGL